jgi:hypothetical protein
VVIVVTVVIAGMVIATAITTTVVVNLITSHLTRSPSFHANAYFWHGGRCAHKHIDMSK